ncbi:MAG: RNA-directed DNA polymerase [Actinomycetota bacterium]
MLDPEAATSYEAAVAALVPSIERSLLPGVLANRARLIRSVPLSLRLEPWRAARERLAREARRLIAHAGAMLVADVRSCYPSIGSQAVLRRLRALGCPPDTASELRFRLESFERAGIPGLPIGPEPSAVLANAVLSEADNALAALGADHLRWVDDFFVFAPDAHAAKAALGALRRGLDSAGLELAEEKTRLVEGRPHIVAAVSRCAVSAVEPGYHRAGHAHPVQGIEDPHALAPTGGRVGPRRRPARPAGRVG